MKLLLNRFFKGKEYTVGHLYYEKNGQMVYICDTMEDVDRGLKKTWSLAQIKKYKIPNETAIPRGTYAITLMVQSPKYKNRSWAKPYNGYLPRLLGVPGFEAVLIHVGNYANPDSSGCILTGMNDRKGMVTKSTMCFNKVYAILKEADDRGEALSITIQ